MKFDRSAVRFGVFAIYAAMQCSYAVAGSHTQEASVTQVRSIASLKELLGRSATLLPSGNMLLVGGQSAGEMSGLIAAENPQTGAVKTLPISLVFHRAFHTATLLTDGSVLVFGGTGTGNKVVPDAERIDLTIGSVQPIGTGALTPRAYHTATLLTDGTVLFAGGVDGNGATLNSLEVWDYRTGTVSKLPIQLQISRRGHEAALLPNGSVLIWGGVDAYGNPVPFGEVIDPRNLTSYGQRVIELPARDPQPPQLAVSIPADDASDVAVNVMIALRFSKPLRVACVNSTTLVCAPSMGALLRVQVPSRVGHNERSEAQLHEGDRVWGGSVDRICGPMNKNRIEGGADQGERASDREALVTKGRCRKSGGRAVKECVLTWGDLALRLKG